MLSPRLAPLLSAACVYAALLLGVRGEVDPEVISLSPPWWTTWRAYEAALAGDRGVRLSAMQPKPCGYTFNISVLRGSEKRSGALATFLSQRIDFGGTELAIRVLDAAGAVVRPSPPADAAEVRALPERALM